MRHNLDMTQPRNGVRVIGVYGVGGIGKTTLCKSLCKEFHMEYEGRVCHAEFKEGGNALDLIREVLKQLTNKSLKALEELNEDECRGLLRKSIKNERVFMAIDNVSDSSKYVADAKMFMQLEYGYGSVVMVTARSLDPLLMLKIEEGNCFEMHELEEDGKFTYVCVERERRAESRVLRATISNFWTPKLGSATYVSVERRLESGERRFGEQSLGWN